MVLMINAYLSFFQELLDVKDVITKKKKMQILGLLMMISILLIKLAYDRRDDKQRIANNFAFSGFIFQLNSINLKLKRRDFI